LSDLITGLGRRSPNPIVSGRATGAPGGKAITMRLCASAGPTDSIFARLTTRSANRNSAAAYLRIASLATLTFNQLLPMFAAPDSLI